MLFPDPAHALQHHGRDAEQDETDDGEVEEATGGRVRLEDDFVQAGAPPGGRRLRRPDPFACGSAHHTVIAHLPPACRAAREAMTVRFLSACGIISSHFRPGRHLYTARGYREVMKLRFTAWGEACCVRTTV